MKYWDKAWSLVDGCTPISAGCDNCWSAAMTYRFDRFLLAERNPLTGVISFSGNLHIHQDRLNIPLKTKKPTIFAVWNDLFHEAVPNDFIYDVIDVMREPECQKHTFIVLTKRPERMPSILKDVHAPNVYFGVTVENQEQADKRIPLLLQIPGKKILSVEPMLGKIKIYQYLWTASGAKTNDIHGVICGGETGHNARPCHPDWVRSLTVQCVAAGVPFFFKGFGTYKGAGDWNIPPGRILDGRTWDELAWR